MDNKRSTGFTRFILLSIVLHAVAWGLGIFLFNSESKPALYRLEIPVLVVEREGEKESPTANMMAKTPHQPVSPAAVPEQEHNQVTALSRADAGKSREPEPEPE